MRPATILSHPVPEYNGMRVMIGDPFKPGDSIPSVSGEPFHHVDDSDGIMYLSDTAFMHISSLGGISAMLYMVEHAWLVKPKRTKIETKQLEISA